MDFFPNDESHFIIKLIKLSYSCNCTDLLERMTSLPASVLVLGIGIIRRQSIGYWVLGAELGIVLTLIIIAHMLSIGGAPWSDYAPNCCKI